MRPRNKPNLDTRFSACAHWLIHANDVEKGQIPAQFEHPDAPVHVEIGCGKGRFACEMAARHPNINFLAIEREENVAVIAVEKAAASNLPNLRFLVDEAACLPKLFEPGTIAQFYINFCDPWHKHRHFKRRLTWRGYLVMYRQLLVPGGELWFKTDNEPLYRFSVGEFDAVFPAYFNTRDLHASQAAAENVMTEYEERFSSQGMPIFALRAKN